MEKKNSIIRKAMTEANLKQWELAELLGIGEQTMCRWLRKELPEDEAKYLQEDIQEITDKAIAKIEEIAKAKQKDIMTI